MAYTSLTYMADETTTIEAFEVRHHPGKLAVSIQTGLAEISLHGNHAQLVRLAAEITEQLAQLAPEAPAETAGV